MYRKTDIYTSITQWTKLERIFYLCLLTNLCHGPLFTIAVFGYSSKVH